MELFFLYYNLLSESFIISSSEAVGDSFRTAAIALFTLAFVNPSITSAVAASSAIPGLDTVNIDGLSLPPPLTTLSLSSRISLCALLSPIPLMLFILFISSERIAFRISSEDRDESIILAVEAPIPETPISSLNSSRSSLVLNP